MRSLALSTSYPLAADDGTAPFIRHISHGLAAHGFSIDVLLPHHPDLRWPEGDPPVQLHTHRYLPPSTLSGWHMWGFAGALADDRAIRPLAYAVLPLAVSSAFGKLVSLVREIRPSVLHAHWILPAGPVVAAVARLTGVPFVVSLHGSGVFVAEKSTAFGLVARETFGRAAAVTACSSDLASRASELGADVDKISTIPYGVDTEAFRPAGDEKRQQVRRQLGVEDGRFVALAVGRLVAKKGFRHLLDAVAEYPEMTLFIAGEGERRRDLQRRIYDQELENRVCLLGSVSREMVGDLYAAADALVVPSVVDEAGNVDGLPNVVLEGMAAGLPIVASDIAGIPDVLRDGENALLVRPGAPEEIGAALQRLRSAAALRAQLGRAAREDAEGGLAWNEITRRYARVLREAAEGEQEEARSSRRKRSRY